MVWIPPPTKTPGDVVTAADWNSFVRDNMMETEVAKAFGGTAQTYMTANGLQQLLELDRHNSTIATNDRTESTSWDSLENTIGPQVITECGPQTLVMIGAGVANELVEGISFCSFTVQPVVDDPSAATAADDPPHDRILHYRSTISALRVRCGIGVVVETEPGLNQFTMVYRVASGVGNFDDRELIVMPL